MYSIKSVFFQKKNSRKPEGCAAMKYIITIVSEKWRNLSAVEKVVILIAAAAVLSYCTGYGIGKFVSHWNHRIPNT